MVYRQDNRKNRISKGNGLKMFLTVTVCSIIGIGIFSFIVNPPPPPEEQPTKQVITYTEDNSKQIPVEQKGEGITPYGVVRSQPSQVQSSQSGQITTYSIDQLRQVALDDINNYRTQAGLTTLPMENAGATQLWANHLLSIGCIQHRDENGGPMQRYVNNGDKLQMVFENVASQGNSGGLDPVSAIKSANNDMMNNDADQNNAHRDNILNKYHKSVSLGIAYDNSNLVIVEDFQEPNTLGWKSFDLAYSDVKAC